MTHMYSYFRIDEIKNFNNAGALGVLELYANDENFNACMIPFNGLRIDYHY